MDIISCYIGESRGGTIFFFQITCIRLLKLYGFTEMNKLAVAWAGVGIIKVLLSFMDGKKCTSQQLLILSGAKN